MASTHDIIGLMEDPDFKKLVGEILAVVAASQQQPGGDVNLACDALSFVNAMIAEANPYHAGGKGLKLARDGLANDAKVMLKVLREHAERNGQLMLFSLTPQPMLN